MNTFVVFASRVIGSLVDGFTAPRQATPATVRHTGYATTIVLDILFGVLGRIIVAWFSRQREFRADAGLPSCRAVAAWRQRLARLA